MKDTAPITYGILAIAAVFAVIAAGVAMVLFDFGLFGAIFIGALIGVIAAIVLALGWRAPAPGPQGVATPTPAAAPTTTAEPKPAAPAPAAAPQPAAAPTPEPTPEPAPKPTPSPAVSDGKPTFLKAARDGGPDDLKRIKGVGPKLEKTLHDMGIFHFDQIATWGPKEQAWMDDNLAGFKGRATRDDWVGQAKVLAAGGAT